MCVLQVIHHQEHTQHRKAFTLSQDITASETATRHQVIHLHMPTRVIITHVAFPVCLVAQPCN